MLPLLAVLVGCVSSEEDTQIYWKDTVTLTNEVVGFPPELDWSVDIYNLPMGEGRVTPAGGFALPVRSLDPDDPYAWVTSWDRDGRLRFNSEKLLVARPAWAVMVASPSGNVFVDYSAPTEEGSEHYFNRSVLIAANGAVHREVSNYEWIPWTQGQSLGDDTAILIAQPDPVQPAVMCRVAMTAMVPWWCDKLELPYRAYEEDTDGATEHAYVPVVEHISPSTDGDFYLVGTLMGTRVATCPQETPCPLETRQIWIARYSSLGEERWSSVFASDPWRAMDVVTGVAPTVDGGLLIGGWWAPHTFTGEMPQQMFVARIDAESAVDYGRVIEWTPAAVITNLVTDHLGEALVHAYSSARHKQIVFKLDDEARLVWSRPFDEIVPRYAPDRRTGGVDTVAPGTFLFPTSDRGVLIGGWGNQEQRLPTQIVKLH